VSIKEAERERLLFLANEADSERRYRPEAHGSAQKDFHIKNLRAEIASAGSYGKISPSPYSPPIKGGGLRETAR